MVAFWSSGKLSTALAANLFLAIWSLDTSIQSAFLTRATLSANQKTHMMTRGIAQVGRRTISAKVCLGLKKTPNILLIVPIGGCCSGAAGGTAVVVAIGKSSTTRLGNTLSLKLYAETYADISMGGF